MADSQQKTRIAMVLFPNMTVLDLVGPYEVLNTPQAEIALVWHRLEPVTAQGGLPVLPTATFESYGAAAKGTDVLFIPGGPGQLAAMDDTALIGFVQRVATGATWITSVCTGSLVLGAAGLLKGRRATCHWAAHDQLALLGATPVQQRVVEDGNVITGAGVTSGIDFGLVLAARLWGEATAKAIQLRLEYDPGPPFAGGSPASAEPAVVAALRERMKDLTERRRAAATRIGKERLGL
jgi:cyclohexyl-isocyanide hydratase